MRAVCFALFGIGLFVFGSQLSLAQEPHSFKGTRGEFPNTNIEFPEDQDPCDREVLAKREARGLPMPAQCKDGAPSCTGIDDSVPPAGPDDLHSSYDDCHWNRKGFVCNAGEKKPKCCEWAKNDSGEFTNECGCNSEFNAVCQNSADCARCLCEAEAGGEPPECVRLVMCVMYKDALEANEDFCKVAIGHSGNAFRFTAARCACDRNGDGRRWEREDVYKPWKRSNPAYNQNYCKCCDALNNFEDVPRPREFQKCEDAMIYALDTNCEDVPWTHYAVDKCPCSPVRKQRRCGNHVFCAC